MGDAGADECALGRPHPRDAHPAALAHAKAPALQGGVAWLRRCAHCHDAAHAACRLRRLARRAGVQRFSRAVYKAARSALFDFLVHVLRYAQTHTEQGRRKTVTSFDVAHGLQLAGRNWAAATSPVAASTGGLFERKVPLATTVASKDDEDVSDLEEDDLARPLSHQQILAYLYHFELLHSETLQDFMVQCCCLLYVPLQL